jgi:plastocyanin
MVRKNDTDKKQYHALLMVLAPVTVVIGLGPSYLTEAFAGGGGWRSDITEECNEAVCYVNMTGLTFAADTLKIKLNTIVVWTNTDKIPHTVTSGSYGVEEKGALFDSGISSLIAGGEKWEHKFTTAGTFEYFCQLHPRMMGQVVVARDPGQEFPLVSLMLAAGVASASVIAAIRLKKNKKKDVN